MTSGPERNPYDLPEEKHERLKGLCPSAKFVYAVIHEHEAVNQDEIVDRTLLPKRTIQHALNTLLDENLIEERTAATDARRRRYRTD